MKIIDISIDLAKDTWSVTQMMPNFLKELALAIFGLFYPIWTKSRSQETNESLQNAE